MADGRRDRAAARRSGNRTWILAAARELVAEGGFRAAPIARIADRAGVATGTVYRYFPSKAALFAELFRQVSGREVAVMAEIAGASGPAGARLERAVAAFARRALLSPRLAYALIAEPVDLAIEAERLAFRRAYARVLAGLVRDGVARGEFRPQDATVTAAGLVGALAEALVVPFADAGATGEAPAPGPDEARPVEAPLGEARAAAMVAFVLRAAGGGAPAPIAAPSPAAAPPSPKETADVGP